MFPFDEDIEDETTEGENEPCEYEVDFTTGQLTGRKVYGLDAIKVWIWIALSTIRYKYQQYSWNVGHEIEELIGKTIPINELKAQLNQMITDCLIQNEHILSIKDLECEKDGDNLRVEFTVVTDIGDLEGVSYQNV